ncbi:MAG: prepilin-type N-terminal cleavage/methylation domain-containing protein [Deltaproteobacteria bacterium]|nr:prepilin-type N-terminal cleavage/methylation domain-containing protein [Deltaproteobacteria bacterium]
MKRDIKQKAGFTLIELMVVVGIFGILAMVSVPALSSFLPGYRFNAAAREMRTNLQLARATAVRRNVRCVVVFDPQAYVPGGRAGGYMMFLDSNNNWQQDDLINNVTGVAGPDGLVDPGEQTVLVSTSMPPGMSLVSAVFTNNGGPASANTDIDGNGALENTIQSTATTVMGFDSHGLAARSTAGAFVFGNVIVRNNQGNWLRFTATPAGQIVIKRSTDGENWE